MLLDNSKLFVSNQLFKLVYTPKLIEAFDKGPHCPVNAQDHLLDDLGKFLSTSVSGLFTVFHISLK